MSALADLLHDIVNRVRVFTEQEAQDLHDKTEAAIEEIKSWVVPAGVKSVEDTQSSTPASNSSTDEGAAHE